MKTKRILTETIIHDLNINDNWRLLLFLSVLVSVFVCPSSGRLFGRKTKHKKASDALFARLKRITIKVDAIIRWMPTQRNQSDDDDQYIEQSNRRSFGGSGGKPESVGRTFRVGWQ